MKLESYRNTHVVLILYYLLYNKDIRFIGDLIKNVDFNTEEKKNVKNLTLNILKYCNEREQILLKKNFKNENISRHDNNNEIINLISTKWELFYDLKNYSYYYGIEISHTEQWDNKLKKLGLFD